MHILCPLLLVLLVFVIDCRRFAGGPSGHGLKGVPTPARTDRSNQRHHISAICDMRDLPT